MRRSRVRAFYLAVFGLFSTTCDACHSASATRASSHTDSPNVCAVSGSPPDEQHQPSPSPAAPGTLHASSPPNKTINLQIEPKARVSDACASYADLDALNSELRPSIQDLTNNTDFFAYYRLNLYNKICPFWSEENGMCGNKACAVITLDNEEDIPEIWRAEELSKLEGPKAQHPGRVQQRERPLRPLLGELGDGVGESCVVEFDDECDERDYCVPEDESASAKGDYVSLADNPERFTGYSGEAAHQVWEAIYRENCFSRPAGGVQLQEGGRVSDGGEEVQTKSMRLIPGSQLRGLSQNQIQAAIDFKRVMKIYGREQQAKQQQPSGSTGSSSLLFGDSSLEVEDECVEKRVFYRIISGMHASISAHLCHDYLNQTTGQWSPNLTCYKERLHRHPERIANLYFNYALVLRAVGKLRDSVSDYTFCTGDAVEDARTKQLLRSLTTAIPSDAQSVFDESTMFRDQTASGLSLKEDFRNRFRNVSRIMDCVGCDKCRLWGKIQINGLGTAMKVLFEFEDGEAKQGGGDASPVAPWLRRTELVALVNTLDKISAALAALEEFRGMVAAEEAEASSPDSSAAQQLGKRGFASASEGTPPYSSAAAVADEQEPAVPSPSYESNPNTDSNTNPEDEADDYDDYDEEEPPLEPVWDIIRKEVTLVFSTMWLIIRTWARLPKTLALVAWAELTRGLNNFLGRPSPQRAWTWRFDWPDREELRQRLEL